MNRIVIMGRLTKDPDLKSTGSGVSVCNTTIAVDRNFTENGKREADFFPIVAWRHNADRKQAMPEDDTEDEPPRRRAADFGGDDNGVPF